MRSAAKSTGENMGKPRDDAADRLRRCIVSRETLPARDLIRFVVGPDGAVVPDPAARLPGRGLWTLARRDIVEDARSRHLFSKAARQPVTVADDLSDNVERLLTRRCLEYVGLARRSGDAVAGFEKTRAALQKGKIVLALVAADCADGSRDKLFGGKSRVDGGDISVIDVFSRVELGGVFDRDETVFAAISNPGIAQKLIDESRRLAGFRTAPAPVAVAAV